MSKVIIPCLLALSLALSGCGFTPFLYKTDIIQGNNFTDADIARIQPGMSRTEVERILGTPQLIDTFHSNRANYLYRYFAGDSKRTYSRKLVIYYTPDGSVEHIEKRDLTTQ
ncbi:MAG: outer membrane protein assembly factor BamE [Cardiobacteriaceae bacterium]|nr:outer membrane protein assembly factor BamE [Cardiobacteriaceae bacterium]